MIWLSIPLYYRWDDIAYIRKCAHLLFMLLTDSLTIFSLVVVLASVQGQSRSNVTVKRNFIILLLLRSIAVTEIYILIKSQKDSSSV